MYMNARLATVLDLHPPATHTCPLSLTLSLSVYRTRYISKRRCAIQSRPFWRVIDLFCKGINADERGSTRRGSFGPVRDLSRRLEVVWMSLAVDMIDRKRFVGQ